MGPKGFLQQVGVEEFKTNQRAKSTGKIEKVPKMDKATRFRIFMVMLLCFLISLKYFGLSFSSINIAVGVSAAVGSIVFYRDTKNRRDLFISVASLCYFFLGLLAHS
jgi:hypothetical protein